MALVSAQELGGPKGAGALVLRQGLDLAAQLRGGGQEMGLRAGTENLIGIAGFLRLPPRPRRAIWPLDCGIKWPRLEIF